MLLEPISMDVLQTSRLTLCHLNPQDAAFMFELMNDPSWIRYIGDRGIRTVEDARAYIQNGPMNSYEQKGYGFYLVKLTKEDLPIGICGLVKRELLEDVDLGYAFLPAHTGKGYAVEAASAVLEYAMTTLNFQRVLAITTQDNQRSIQLLEKIGLKYEGTVTLPSQQEELKLFGTT
ncbi:MULTISPECIES: GNAT family N-acetyltransferase [Rufibacter]|uniref:RimJ/RimL family protein N-acetyltransferase n=1 Tax=Rufibacter quisquiliarum TaxID=1549639 RepID=A0A839GHR0_9BACT|nr:MULTISPECIES: GNAT family N-acetyltransferase [Rufibacter]MBA9076239.1 RimJ/RimL family protein N-acetyltransferase [Rufibacter quisquiliarum]